MLKKIDPSDPVTQSKPGTQTGHQAGSKNYAIFSLVFRLDWIGFKKKNQFDLALSISKNSI